MKISEFVNYNVIWFNDKKIYISVTDIKIDNNKILFNVLKYSSYRKFVNEKIEVLNQNVFIIDYSKVYKNG